MRDLLRRLVSTDLEVVQEMVRREAFEQRDLRRLFGELRKAKRRPDIQQLIERRLRGFSIDPCPAWLAALANADRQIAIHAVVNASLSDEELLKFDKLTKLQRDGHLVQQLRAAIEIEWKRRKICGHRSPRNRATTRRS